MKESSPVKGPGASTNQDNTRNENNPSIPHSKEELTENERIILGREAHEGR